MDKSVLLLQRSLQLAVVVLLATAATKSVAADDDDDDDDAVPSGCKTTCGGVQIPYPFGLSEGCYLRVPGQDADQQFKLSCNSTNSQLQFLHNPRLYNIASITVGDSELQVMVPSGRYCYQNNDNGKEELNTTAFDRSMARKYRIDLDPFYRISEKNKILALGCNNLAFLKSDDPFTQASTFSFCPENYTEFPTDCGGFGCAESSFKFPAAPAGLHNISVSMWRLGDLKSYIPWDLGQTCNYAFVVDPRNFTFVGKESVAELQGPRQELPVVVNWAIGNDTCEAAKQKNETGFACNPTNTECVNRTGGGYFCRCATGYAGNPYLLDVVDCKDVNECLNLTLCGKYTRGCSNLEGSYICDCMEGFIHEKNDPNSCTLGGLNSTMELKIALGVCLSFLVTIMIVFWIYRGIKVRKLERLQAKYFENNGGDKLREMMEKSKGHHPVKMYTHDELKQATNNLNNKEKIGEGAYGTVYKGTLPDKTVVAIKVPKSRDPLKVKSETDQFANEVIILSGITHKNVVRLLGCCLETEMPILVYEYINNGTVYEHIHKPKGKEPLSFHLRLKIAIETAASLMYLHYENVPQIVHRDVKTSNILVDDKFTAKVSDFGVSKFVSEDQNAQATYSQGTPGYLDPEYLQSNILTEKSDVYSFGVVLVELITSHVAISSSKPEKERSLASHFITSMNEDRLHQILDLEIIKEGSFEVAEKVALLALKCLRLKGSGRPTMREVSRELEAIEQLSPNQFPLAKGWPDASRKETCTLLSTSSPSSYYHAITISDYDNSLPDDASLLKHVDGGR